jgi:hypothetical protein
VGEPALHRERSGVCRDYQADFRDGPGSVRSTRTLGLSM